MKKDQQDSMESMVQKEAVVNSSFIGFISKSRVSSPPLYVCLSYRKYTATDDCLVSFHHQHEKQG